MGVEIVEGRGAVLRVTKRGASLYNQRELCAVRGGDAALPKLLLDFLLLFLEAETVRWYEAIRDMCRERVAATPISCKCHR